MFLLKDIIDRHEKDCKAVTYLGDLILSTSRDHTFFVGEILNADNFLNSIYVRDDIVLVGCQNGILYKYQNKLKTEYPVHNGNITSITSLDGYIITGGWDNTVRITLLNDLKSSKHVNLPHAVWALLVIDSNIFVGCADGNIYHLDKQLNIKNTIHAHKQPVRGLALYKGQIVSCSNDASIKIWDTTGSLQSEWFGHTSFIYSLTTITLDTEYVVSVGEDQCCKIWLDGNIIQNIPIPEVSLWNVASHGSNIAIASSSGRIYEFTTKEEQKANNEMIARYESNLQQFSLNKETIGDIDMSKIPSKDILDKPGPKEGHVQMIKEESKIMAYSWSGGKWVKIGEVVNAVGNSRKQIFEGKEYDYVFDVDLDGKMMKLPYNTLENPFSAALSFLNKNQLDQVHLDDVANFIVKNTGSAANLQQPQGSDPFTGGHKYTPQYKDTPNIQTTNQTHSKFEYASFIQNYYLFKSGNMDKIKAKIEEYNVSNKDKADPEKISIPSQENLHLMTKILLAWPDGHKFPILDIFRLNCLENSTNLCELLLQDEFLSQCGLSDDRNLLMILRAYCNIFNANEDFIKNNLNSVILKVAILLPSKSKSIQVFAALLLNIAVLMVKHQCGKAVFCRNIFQLLTHCLTDVDEIVAYRCLLAAKLLVTCTKLGNH
eukprot:NODE_301_length_10368_cov_0.471614.p2 type:complete len:658 gc:universal NODE_301_length_10368_cov_0.471614:5196-3223(-)